MNKMKNKVFLNFFGFVLILLSVVSCSNSDQVKVQKEKKNTPYKAEMAKTKPGMDNISKTTCTHCHNTDDKGDLAFRNKDGMLEFRKNIKTKNTPEVN